MELDKNRIAIRERDYFDVLDLALRVIRVHAWPLVAAFAVGVVPMTCLNYWLLADYVELVLEIGFPATYMWYMLLLVVWQIPLATAPVTLYLGQALFSDRPRFRDLMRGWWSLLPQIVWYQVVFRSFVAAALLSPALVLVSLPACIFLFSWRPYLGEVILLERNPMFARRSGRMTTRRRSRAFHGGRAGDLFVRWLGSMVIGTALFTSLWVSTWLLRSMLVSEGDWDTAMYTVCFPLAMWLVVGYFTVVRFLSYLDLRIRLEGWEVELMMRAEQPRLTRQWT